MSIIPNFLLRKLYKRGSLRPIDEGIAFDLKNIIGPGIITQVNLICLNDQMFSPDKIKILMNGKSIKCDQITPDNPLFCTFNQMATLVLMGSNSIIEGINNITVELISREAGLIQVQISDNYAT